MEYRVLPHSNGEERYSVLGLGLGGIQEAPEAEIHAAVELAIENGINFFDLCAGGKKTYAPVGRAFKGRREQVHFQLHLGAVYNAAGEYAWSRDLDEMKAAFHEELALLQTDYADFGFLHCVDTMEDLETLKRNGALAYLEGLHAQGVIRHMGFSSHTPAVAEALLDLGNMDMMMFSLNPAYDYEQGDEWGVGSNPERMNLLRRCSALGVGVSVMKPFFAGKLLDEAASPFGQALSIPQCLQYALDRPAVLSVVPGPQSLADVRELLAFLTATAEEKDYSRIGSFEAARIAGSCVYCNHCQPCPAGIDIGLVNKYYDLARMGDCLAVGHYEKLSIGADACLSCGHCEERCPFLVQQEARMREIAAYFGGK